MGLVDRRHQDGDQHRLLRGRDSLGQEQRDQAADDDGAAAEGQKVEDGPEQIALAPDAGRFRSRNETWSNNIDLRGVGHGNGISG
jgi:hypothetical protein